ncbi:MAG: hypothetical protein V1768_02930, partial [Patescibacteria group bacterium]
MDSKELLDLIKNKKQTILSVLILFFIITIIITAIQPFKYGSVSRLLVVQNFPAGTDPYAISKSNEYLSAILAKVVTSNLFYSDIMSAGFNIDKNYFTQKGEGKKEMKKWEETASARALSDTGIIEIQVFHPNREQLAQISQAINYVLKTKNNIYHGGGNNVDVKVIDKPIISSWPVKPNIFLNFFLALIFSLIIAFSYIYLFPDEKYNIKLWPKKRRTLIKKEQVFEDKN